MLSMWDCSKPIFANTHTPRARIRDANTSEQSVEHLCGTKIIHGRTAFITRASAVYRIYVTGVIALAPCMCVWSHSCDVGVNAEGH
jgi:hypothetical protein